MAVLHGVDLTDTQVRMLTDGTEGWPVGLRLAVVALRDRRADERDHGEFLERLLDADPTIADYLTGEVLDDLDDGVLRFLRVVSVTDELPVSLAAALSGGADAGALLARLARKTALVTSKGATDPKYRVHGLLRSYLRADLDREQPELVDGLHRAAARWYEERGLLGSALDHARRAGHREWTADFLMRNASELYLRGDLGAAPASVRHIVGADGHTAPALAQVGALVDLATGRLSTVTTRSLAAMDVAEGAEPLLAELVASQAAVLTGRPWKAAGNPRPGESWARVASRWSALLDGELGRARDDLDVAEELSARRGHDLLQLQVHVARAALEFSDGRYPAMDEPCVAAAALVRERGWPSSPWLAAAQTLQAFRALQLTETQRALSSVAAADRAHSALLPAGMALLLRAVEAAARSDTGDAVAAAVALRRARHTLALHAVPRIVVGLAAVVEHELALRAGAGGGAVRDLLASVEDRLDGTAELVLLQARSLVGAPADDELIRRLAPIRNGAAAALLPSTAVDAELICAALAIRAGDRTVARGAVEKALVRAADIELVRPFARAGHGVRAFLVEQAGSFGPYDEFVGRALVATKADVDDRGATPLTVRERSVLARLPLPRSLDEVARDLGVSANTVKDPRPCDLHQVRGHQPPAGRHGCPQPRAVVKAPQDGISWMESTRRPRSWMVLSTSSRPAPPPGGSWRIVSTGGSTTDIGRKAWRALLESRPAILISYRRPPEAGTTAAGVTCGT